MLINHLDVKNFSDFIENNQIVIVDFWAQWCAPCLSFEKTFEQVASQYPNVCFGKVDIESNAEMADTFEIRSIPHLMVFKEGIAIYSESGSMPQSTLVELVEQAISIDVSDIKKEIGE